MRMDDVAEIAFKCFPDTLDQLESSITDEMREVLGAPIIRGVEVRFPFKEYPRTYMCLYANKAGRVVASDIVHIGKGMKPPPLDQQIRVSMDYADYLLGNDYDAHYLSDSLAAYGITAGDGLSGWPVRTKDANVFCAWGGFFWREIP